MGDEVHNFYSNNNIILNPCVSLIIYTNFQKREGECHLTTNKTTENALAEQSRAEQLDLDNLPAKKNIYIYGAGIRGIMLAIYLEDVKNIHPVVVVSDGHRKNSTYSYLGKERGEIYEFGALGDLQANNVFFINTIIQGGYKIRDMLVDRFGAAAYTELTDKIFNKIIKVLPLLDRGQFLPSSFYLEGDNIAYPIYEAVPPKKAAEVEGSELYEIFMNNTGKTIDKWHHYFPIYERHFFRFRDRKIKVLEVGVYKGGSLRMWKKYFGPAAEIHGLDIVPECEEFALPEQDIYVHIGDQSDGEYMRTLMDKIGPVDILIDDGGHTMQQQITTFLSCYDKLTENGVYLCEDLHTSLWANFMDYNENFIDFVKKHIDLLYLYWFSNSMKGALGEQFDNLMTSLEIPRFTTITDGIHFYDSVVVFERGNKGAPVRSLQ